MGLIYYAPMQLSCYLALFVSSSVIFPTLYTIPTYTISYRTPHQEREAAIRKMVVVLWILALLGVTEAGQLRVPKVYNAVITSNQNLSPSRAFPVIQPVIHRTAIGYVPPFYYTQVLPSNAGSEIIRLPEGALESEALEPKESRTKAKAKANDVPSHQEENTGRVVDSTQKDRDDQLSFFPNYHSLYYDPYIYTYNGYKGDLAAGTAAGVGAVAGSSSYYVDYERYSAITPISPSLSSSKHVQDGRLLPAYHDQINSPIETKKAKDNVPDVPSPPVPPGSPKHS